MSNFKTKWKVFWRKMCIRDSPSGMTADGEGVELSEKLFEEESEELPPQEAKKTEEANTAAAARTTKSFF